MRPYLAVVGVLYLALALWCSISPDSTARAVGFTLKPGSGQSEYLVVYGGLQFALGLFLLWPLRQPQWTTAVLLFCVLLHGCLVGFRLVSTMLFDNLGTTTLTLAVIEWLIFIPGMLLWRQQPNSRRPAALSAKTHSAGEE